MTREPPLIGAVTLPAFLCSLIDDPDEILDQLHSTTTGERFTPAKALDDPAIARGVSWAVTPKTHAWPGATYATSDS